MQGQRVSEQGEREREVHLAACLDHFPRRGRNLTGLTWDSRRPSGRLSFGERSIRAPSSPTEEENEENEEEEEEEGEEKEEEEEEEREKEGWGRV